MDSFEFNKIAMGVLGTVFVLMGLGFISDALFTSHAPEKAGYAIEAADGEAQASTPTATGPAYEPIAAMLASADLDAGAKVAKKCLSCHTFDKGGKNKVGPNLYNVIGSNITGVSGFGYSAALKAYGEGKSWDFAAMNGFLFKPKKFVKGTAMGFSGLKKAADRANVIAYIRSKSDAPVALPTE